MVPVPALQIGWYLLVATALAGARRRGYFRRPGTAWLLTLTAFAAGRLALEGLRDPAADFLGTTVVFGLKQTQWALLTATAVGAAVLMWRRRILPIGPPAAPVPDQPLANLLVMLGLLTITLWPTAAPLLTGVEVLLIRLMLAPVLALEVTRVVRLARQHPILPGLLTLSLLLMSQVPASAPDAPPAAPVTAPARPTTTLLLGGTGGSAYQLFEPHSSCNPSHPNIKSWPGYYQTSGAAMAGLERTWPQPNGSTVALGARLSRGAARASFSGVEFMPRYAVDPSGYQYISGYDTTRFHTRLNRPLMAFSPYMQYNKRTARGGWIRMRFGMHLGRVAYDYAVSPYSVRRVTPELLIETQSRQGLLLHASINDGLLGVGNGTWRTGVGLTPGAQRWALLAGAATTNANGQHYVQLQILGDDGRNFYAPIGAFAELRLQPTPRGQLLVSSQSNFNDFRTVTASARIRLGK